MNIYQAQITKLVTITDPLAGSGINTIWDVVTHVLDIVIPLASILFVGMFIYAGISYIISVGEAAKVKSAQAMMTNAIIGLVIISFAFVILRVVEKGISGV